MSHAATTASSRDFPHAWRYYASCVSWPKNDVHADGGLIDMIDRAREIKRMAFMRAVNAEDREHLETMLGYERHPHAGMTMKDDGYVRYFRSRLHGVPVYYFEHSRIEYVFTLCGIQEMMIAGR